MSSNAALIDAYGIVSINKFKTSDGQLHETLDKAVAHQDLVDVSTIIDSILRPAAYDESSENKLILEDHVKLFAEHYDTIKSLIEQKRLERKMRADATKEQTT
jgi:phage gp36-like protein